MHLNLSRPRVSVGLCDYKWKNRKVIIVNQHLRYPLLDGVLDPEHSFTRCHSNKISFLNLNHTENENQKGIDKTRKPSELRVYFVIFVLWGAGG